jgi:hypothetical protein
MFAIEKANKINYRSIKGKVHPTSITCHEGPEGE